MLPDVEISEDRNVIEKEAKKFPKYTDLTTEIQRMWNVTTKVITVITGATGTISKIFRKYLKNIRNAQHEETTENSHIWVLHTYFAKY
jgi:Zn-dependent peptidase ImmA (M78 family)